MHFLNENQVLKTYFSFLFVIVGGQLMAQQLILKSESDLRTMPVSSSPSMQEVMDNKPEKPFEPKNFKSVEKAIIEMEHQVVMVGKLAPAGLDIYTIPLFGGYQKNLEQIQEDERFLRDCDQNFNNRREASQFFSNMGWQYLSEGSKEMATYRFNMAHLLDAHNVDVYWGLGVIEFQKQEHEEAIRLMKLGLENDHEQNVTLMVDLATVYIKCFTTNQHQKDLSSAFDLLDKAQRVSPNFVNTYI